MYDPYASDIETFNLKSYFDAYGPISSLTINQVEIGIGERQVMTVATAALVAGFDNDKIKVVIGDINFNFSWTTKIVELGAPQPHWIWMNRTNFDYYTWTEVNHNFLETFNFIYTKIISNRQ